MDKAYAVIMAGGKGERFWPLSTSKHPKQVLSLFGDKPMLAMAVDYLRGLVRKENIFVITSVDLVGATCEAAPDLPRGNVIGEPFGRDTAAVCALGSALVKARESDGVFCVMTADHVIEDIPVFQALLAESMAIAAKNDVLITIGIKPTYPSTGFGYVEADEKFPHTGKIKFRRTRRFVEKPKLETAQEYLRLGNFFWNSGMFIWSAESIQRSLAVYRPALLEMAKRMTGHAGKPDFDSLLKEEYTKLDRISIDYAVMEKAKNIVMAEGAFGWDDVGSWIALQNHIKADSNGNVVVGSCESIEGGNNIVVSRERLTALIGVRDLVVVQAGNATLICPKERAQDVKKMVQHLAGKDAYRDLL